MLSWSDSPFTNWINGAPRPGMGIDLYELDRSKLYCAGLKSTVMTLPLSAPSRTVMVAFLSCGLLMARPSESAPLALDPDSALDSPDHIISEPIDRRRVQRCALHD